MEATAGPWFFRVHTAETAASLWRFRLFAGVLWHEPAIANTWLAEFLALHSGTVRRNLFDFSGNGIPRIA